MKPLTQPKEKPKSLDFTLLLSRLEADIIRGGNLGPLRKVLVREDIWKRADVHIQHQWARVSQMAGEVETSLRILCHINGIKPDMKQAWVERIELLLILDRRQEIAVVAAAVREHVDEKTYATWISLCERPYNSINSEEIAESMAPFGELKRRQKGIENFLELFSGREDCFARQWVDKKEGKQGYVPVRRPMEEQDVEDHLKGRKTYGIYLIRSDETVRVAVIDADLVKQYRNGKLKAEDRDLIKRERSYLFSRTMEISETIGLKPLVEFSGGKGFHFWYFFASSIKAGEAKVHINGIKNDVGRDLTAFNLEVFPKQAQLTGKGLGNLVKLPLGIHRLSGKKSYFMECSDRSIDAQLDFLTKVVPIQPSRIKSRKAAAPHENVMVHPRYQKWADDYPELSKLERLCPPMAQLIAACRHGKALSLREEKVLFQTVGFLSRAKSLLHHIMAFLSDYNPHLVDFKLSKIRGTPLGCKRIHSLLNFNGDICPFEGTPDYAHPLLHLKEWHRGKPVKSEKVENLQGAMENLKLAVLQVQRFLV